MLEIRADEIFPPGYTGGDLAAFERAGRKRRSRKVAAKTAAANASTLTHATELSEERGLHVIVPNIQELNGGAIQPKEVGESSEADAKTPSPFEQWLKLWEGDAVARLAFGVNKPKKPKVTVHKLIRAAAKHYGVSLIDIVSARRTADIVDIRHEVFWLAKKLTTYSLPHIGRHVGGRDHTSVLHAVRKIQRQIDSGVRPTPCWFGSLDT